MFDCGQSGMAGIEVQQPWSIPPQSEWRRIDAALRAIASRRAMLDAEEARWLIEARRSALHRHLGFATLLEYMERVLGYGPHAAKERLRVADALEELPAMRDALASGRLPFSAVRELSRVATGDTEVAWLAAAEGRTLREIEPMVAGRRRGDLPGDPPDPERLRHALRFEVSGPTLALLRDARRALEDEVGERLDDDQLVAALCKAVLGGPRDEGRATHQIAITVCETCDRAWQDGAGAAIEIPPVAVERACCDAQHIGRVDADVPARATQNVPPALRRLVWRRDHGRCVVPGCRSSTYLEVHHVQWRMNGGRHSARNCCVLCDAHHGAVHAGRLVITGSAPALTFTHDDGRPYGAPFASVAPPPRSAPPSPLRADAIDALRRLGFTLPESRAAVATALSHVGGDAAIEDVLRRALIATRAPL
jgi:hypothetical protein